MSAEVLLYAVLLAGVPGCLAVWLGAALQRSHIRQKQFEDEAEQLRGKLGEQEEITEEWGWETDTQHRFTWFSPNYTRLSGHPPSYYLGKARWEVANLEVEDGFWEEHRQTLDAHKPFNSVIYMARGHDGGLRVFRTSGQPRFDAAGDFLGYRGVATDITKVASAGDQVDVAQRRLQDAVDLMPQGLALYDAEERLILANRIYRDRYLKANQRIEPGMSFEELARATRAQGLVQGWSAEEEAALQHRLAIFRRPPYCIEQSYQDGSTLQVMGSRMSDGGQVVLWTDITEMKRREKALTLLITGPARGRDFLETACEAITVLLNYRFSGIARIDRSGRRARILSCWLDGKPGESFSYTLEGTPCDKVYGQSGRCYYPDRAGERFPDDEILAEFGGRAFTGEALYGRNGEKMGHLFAIHDAPDSEEPRHSDILNLIARWVATELERREAEEERLHSARLLQIFFDHMTEGITVVDKELQVLAYNRRYLEIVNLPRQLMAQGDYREVLRYSAERGDYGPGNVEELVEQRIQRLFRPRPCVSEEFRPNGRNLEIRTNPLPDGGVVATYVDITDRKQAEERLRESEHRYRLISELASDLVFSYALDEDGRLGLEWYAGTLLSRLSLPGLPDTTEEWETLVVAEDRPVLRQCLLKLARGEDCSEEIRLQCDSTPNDREESEDSGQDVWVRILARGEHEPESGRLNRVLGAAQDVSERKNAESEMLQAMQATELANRTKSDFLATMSHELRTPLNAIIGFAEIMEQEMLGPLGDGRYREYSHDIKESGSHLLRIINDILEVSKAEAGRLELYEEDFRLLQLVESSVRLVQHRAEDSGVALDWEMPERELQICADQRRLKQVLLNLLSNAIKFTPEGGTVVLKAYGTAEGNLRLEVQDSGIGIEPEDIQRVFEPFTQLDSGLERRHEGTGLGLPLSRMLVELHGGELTLESRPGQGTRATILLPPERLLGGRDAPLRVQA